MSETQMTHKNGAAYALPVIGALAAVIGIILWIAGTNQLAHDTAVNSFSSALGGLTTGNTSGDQIMIFAGIALLVVGVILLLVRLIIAAVRN